LSFYEGVGVLKIEESKSESELLCTDSIALVSSLGIKERRSIHRVSDFIIQMRHTFGTVGKNDENGRYSLDFYFTTVMNYLFCLWLETYGTYLLYLLRTITIKMQHPRIYNFIELNMFPIPRSLLRACITQMSFLKIVGSKHVQVNKIILLLMMVYFDGYFLFE
jgi:hypothetical protein